MLADRFASSAIATVSQLLNYNSNSNISSFAIVQVDLVKQFVLSAPNEIRRTAKPFKTCFSSMFLIVRYVTCFFVIFSTRTQFFCSVCNVLQNTKTCERWKEQNQCFCYKLREHFFTQDYDI